MPRDTNPAMVYTWSRSSAEKTWQVTFELKDEQMQKTWTRRGLLSAVGATSAVGLAACTSVSGSEKRGRKIDARVDAALGYLENNVPGSADLIQRAAGVLVMPLITEAGFGIGAAYGNGALRVQNSTVDYYSSASGSFGFQIGAQQYAHALFFMTQEALTEFRGSSGFSVGGDVEYAVTSHGGTLTADSTTVTRPVIAIIFGQAGLIAGATLEGTKYTRIFP